MRESERFEECEWHCDDPTRWLVNACGCTPSMMVEGVGIRGLNSAELRLREILAQSAIQSLVLEAVNKQSFLLLRWTLVARHGYNRGM